MYSFSFENNNSEPAPRRKLGKSLQKMLMPTSKNGKKDGKEHDHRDEVSVHRYFFGFL
jgi:hypothetical protein